ncbi:hypothetical protein B0J14DRAFT_603578 [Halenospora varia]|nr:hypothetical protein B0J14DRAFT_603578 [Halenospora varia]
MERKSNQNNPEISRNPISNVPQNRQQLSDTQKPPPNMLKRKADSLTETSSTTHSNILEHRSTKPLNGSIATAAARIPASSPSNPYISNRSQAHSQSTARSHNYQAGSSPTTAKKRNMGYQSSHNPNQPDVQYNMHSSPYSVVGIGNTFLGDREREVNVSTSPSTQLLQPTPHIPPDRAILSREGFAQMEPPGPKVVETPLIDTLPRKKQKQIFGIIGGLQSGIRNVRQQADGLQKQLDALQASLGIDGDDDDGV